MGLIVAGLATLFLVQGAAFFIRSYLFGLIGQRVYADLRERLFSSLLAREIEFFDAHRASELSARISSDAALVQDAVSVKLSVIIRYSVQVIFGVALMVTISGRLSLALILSVLVMVSTSGLFIKRLKTASRAYQSALTRFASFCSESVNAIRAVRSLGAEADLFASSKRLNSAAELAGEGRILWGARFSAGASAMLNVLLLLVAWYGVSLVRNQTLALNELAAFVLYGAIVAVSFSFLIGAYAELTQSLGGLERVFELAFQGDQIEQSSIRQRVVRAEATQALGVTFDRVTFAYPNREEQLVLDNFSAVIEPGRFTALVGPSGAGKSSLAQLVCRLYKPIAGEIVLTSKDQHGSNPAPLSSLSEEDLRRLVAWVPQEPVLFGFSIYENLVLGNREISRDELLKTVKGWEFLDFLEPLEEGIDTVLGEHGALLSGGQRQRIAIARAMLRRPALLVLDEATAALDSQSEEQVMRAIREYLPHQTLLVISHRLASVFKAERILVIDEGRIVESGTHAELVQGAGLYQKYSQRQGLSGISKSA
jgi:ATP-binding cassette subfamily B protein